MNISSKLVSKSKKQTIFNSIINGKNIRITIVNGIDITDDFSLDDDAKIHVLMFNSRMHIRQEINEPIMECSNGDVIVMLCADRKSYNYAVGKFESNSI
ncbi:hypothetical protein PSI22_20285 [Xenorhabdus sp. XENO-7]|uniref:Uncharacterized protein n=1 Tax=Xenorhabdus aichiensis TaxID=3025874 RepID=A0ABT5M8A2_9GAMM|nr:hypothetical protein [Xenorhabdus aichiensis]MDC9623909.1 hypothetical protein [Xenorhabdus aichiensis]